jgi:hypothetical protein
LLKWFLDGPLPKLCPLIPTSNQDGRQALPGLVNLVQRFQRRRFKCDLLSKYA